MFLIVTASVRIHPSVGIAWLRQYVTCEPGRKFSTTKSCPVQEPGSRASRPGSPLALQSLIPSSQREKEEGWGQIKCPSSSKAWLMLRAKAPKCSHFLWLKLGLLDRNIILNPWLGRQGKGGGPTQPSQGRRPEGGGVLICACRGWQNAWAVTSSLGDVRKCC